MHTHTHTHSLTKHTNTHTINEEEETGRVSSCTIITSVGFWEHPSSAPQVAPPPHTRLMRSPGGDTLI